MAIFNNYVPDHRHLAGNSFVKCIVRAAESDDRPPNCSGLEVGWEDRKTVTCAIKIGTTSCHPWLGALHLFTPEYLALCS